MPTYEYKCTNDGSTFELWQEVGAGAPPCPTCGAATKKVFHPTRTIFKGAGFYVTDLRSESEAKTKTPAASETKTGAAKDDAKPEAPKTDAKADAKADAAPAATPSESSGAAE